MDNNKKNSFWSSIKSMFANLFKSGGQRREELEDLIADDVVISPSKQIARNFFENKLGVTGLVAFVLIFVVVFGTTSFRPYNSYEHETVLNNLAPGTKYLNIPKEIQGKNIDTISSGTSYSVALDDAGKVHFWGQRPDKKFKVDQIVEKTKNSKIKSLASGDKFVVAVTENNQFIGVGENTFSQTELPFDVMEELGSDNIVKVAAGKRFTAIVTDTGKIYTWGSVLENNLDNIPKSIQGRVKDIAIGQFNIIALLDDGSLVAFGQGGTEVGAIPTELTDGSVKVTQVELTKTSAIALDADGNVHTWGAQGKYQSVPELDGKVVQIASTLSSFNALTESGSVYAWGEGKFNLTDVPSSVTNVKNKQIFSDHFQSFAVSEDNQINGWGNKGFILGTDEMGRSIGERLLYGGRISLTVGAIAMILSTFIGVFVGLIAGFYGGWVDNLLMRIAEVISAFPFLPLAITLSALLPTSTTQSQRLAMIMVILGVISWPGVARLVRGQILAEREKDFVLAARALGLKEKTIIIRHILPSVFNFIIVNMTLGYASSLLTEAGLSYLGFGVKRPSPSWGNMLDGVANTTVIENYWWQWLLPALCVMLTALSVNLMGDALRDAMDPKSNQK
ncbi:ABC transporter permease subunit [Erysipelothrix rhusiopathiae]|uniref:ABC transporter permease subunit n=1 Tax=Erysipelothrix rhusiopathiae TaxID=1648 RepID=UPI001EE01F55|nr:ABC transporter permease subunit [Erysipelothrix rhusiopathiae]MCG4436654.1 ABC transporter permease subunit [Erysipelothrix rhusiopathiae]MDE8043629.1 ABC transporter permease subunit [Erysipelothrix rhusiopathiae]MDE8060014.1 ABC transporter permease subunit [Erysipelothrix rhusiopathiae]MDE8068470.1 ABC transporter permease subunit [Erysipelothrix rhusiopathiae]MDE8078563.1 ABC transporter permease subunit [Erysipelothrix rhusiopathiae]